MSGTSRSSRVFELGLWCATLLLSTAVVYAQTAQAQSDVEGAASALEKSPGTLRVGAETQRALPTPILPSFVDSQNGSSVEDLIGVATARNPALLAARQNIVISQGRIVQAGLRPNPSISVDATNDRGFGSEGEGGFGISYAHPVELGGNRTGDHIWWISDLTKFMNHFPGWHIQYDVPRILREIYEENIDRWSQDLRS